MGSPGCGKSTTAEAVGDQLGLTVVDVDEYLERHWKTSVANKVHINCLCDCSSSNCTLSA